MRVKRCETERGRKGNAIQTSSRAIFRSSCLPDGSPQLALNPKALSAKKNTISAEGACDIQAKPETRQEETERQRGEKESMTAP